MGDFLLKDGDSNLPAACSLAICSELLVLFYGELSMTENRREPFQVNTRVGIESHMWGSTREN